MLTKQFGAELGSPKVALGELSVFIDKSLNLDSPAFIREDLQTFSMTRETESLTSEAVKTHLSMNLDKHTLLLLPRSSAGKLVKLGLMTQKDLNLVLSNKKSPSLISKVKNGRSTKVFFVIGKDSDEIKKGVRFLSELKADFDGVKFLPFPEKEAGKSAG